MDAPYDLRSHNGIITMRNPTTDGHRTIKIYTQPEDAEFAPGMRILSLLTGPDNTSDYQDFGFVIVRDNEVRAVPWRRYRDSGPWRKYCAMIQFPVFHMQRHGVEYRFEGRCRRCNRPLTTPESIDSGIGPVCVRKERERATVQPQVLGNEE
jgi:hypothetical protein